MKTINKRLRQLMFNRISRNGHTYTDACFSASFHLTPQENEKCATHFQGFFLLVLIFPNSASSPLHPLRGSQSNLASCGWGPIQASNDGGVSFLYFSLS